MKKLNRLLFGMALCVLAATAQTGTPVPELAAFDQAIPTLLKKYDVPGAAISIAKDGRQVYARGFGAADWETGEPVQPDSLFRIASVSKPLTAVGVLKLVEDGKVTLDTRVLPFVGRQATADIRYNDITVRHLLQHSAGLDIEFWGFDPSFPDRDTLVALGAPLPPSRSDILDFVLANLPLASAPGTKFAYSNIGFMLLTDVIEKASGQAYETYMREKILAPLGIARMRIAGSLLTDRQPGEVRYWDEDNVAEPIFSGLPELVPTPYGSFNIGIFESGGGWLAPMTDLLRFLTAFDTGSTYSILRPETVRLMTERPSYVTANETDWYGLGWDIEQSALGERWAHSGALQGTAAWVLRGVNGVSLAVALNHIPDDDETQLAFLSDFATLFTNTALTTTRWPAGDIFGTYFPGQSPRISTAGVVNAASQRPGPIAAGSVALIFGVNLDGATVRVNGVPADTLWTAPGQLFVRVPLSANGKTTFQAEGNGRLSNIESVDVRSEAPAIFTNSRNGYGQASALNEDGSANAPDQPAAAGSLVAVYATGVTDPAVTVGGLPAEVVFSGQAPGMPSGVQQINVRLPQGIPSGQQPIVIQSRDGQSQNGVTLSVQ